MADIDISLVIPVYNEEDSLALLQNEITRVMKKLSLKYEVIYVDDGSTDSSLNVLKKISKEYPDVRIISFMKNYGQSVAFYSGFRQSRGKWIATLDADMQNPPSEIVKLLEFRDDADFITGVRKKRKDGFVRKLSSKIARASRYIVLGDITQDVGCSLRLFKRKIIESISFFKNFHRFFTLLVRDAGFKVKEVEVAHMPRYAGKSKYTTFKRAIEGLFDLFGVFWLRKRPIFYVKKEIIRDEDKF